MSEMIHIDERCPHCRIPLHMSQDRAMARRGFECPACKKGLIWIGSWGKRLQAIAGFGLGGAIVLMIFVVFVLIGGCVVLMIIHMWQEHYLVLGVVSVLYVWVFTLVARWTWGSQRALLGMMIGRKLIPALHSGGHWRFDLTPIRPKFRRRKNESLHGAVTLHDDGPERRGALSIDQEPRA